VPRSSCGPRSGSATTTRGAWSPKRFAHGLKNSADSTTWESVRCTLFWCHAFSSSAHASAFAKSFRHELLRYSTNARRRSACRPHQSDGAPAGSHARALPVELRVSTPGGISPLSLQRLGRPHQTQAGADNHDVARAEVLLRAVIERSHPLGDRLILQDDAGSRCSWRLVALSHGSSRYHCWRQPSVEAAVPVVVSGSIRCRRGPPPGSAATCHHVLPLAGSGEGQIHRPVGRAWPKNMVCSSSHGHQAGSRGSPQGTRWDLG